MRIRAPLRSAARMRWARWPPGPRGWPAAAPRRTAPARGDADPRAEAVVIHVLAESATLTARPDPQMSGDDGPAREQPPCEPAPAAPPAVLLGGRVLPAPLLAELAARGAKVRPVAAPDARSGYRPSTALSVFARLRDMTCRWPGCDRPAQCHRYRHTTPYPGGPTHPSNNKCYCRKHCCTSRSRQAKEFAETLRYREVTAKRCHCRAHLELVSTAVVELEP